MSVKCGALTQHLLGYSYFLLTYHSTHYLNDSFNYEFALYATLASDFDNPPNVEQVPFSTSFHSPLSLSSVDWPAHECVPATFAQSF